VEHPNTKEVILIIQTEDGSIWEVSTNDGKIVGIIDNEANAVLRLGK